MKRYQWVVLIALSGFGVGVVPAFGQDDPNARLQQLQQLQKQREAARLAAQAAAANKPPPPPPPTVTVAPTQTVPPRPTVTARPTATPTATQTVTVPIPRPTVSPLPTTTATATATATAPSASASAVASARPKAVDPAKLVDLVAVSVEKLRATRQDRRHAEAERMQQRWGELAFDDRAKSELRLHAQRVAYLQRIRVFAEKAGDTKLVESVDQLITQEERRDADAMNALRSGAPGGK